MKQSNRDRVITFRMSAAEERLLRLTSRAESVSPSELIRQAVEEKADRLVTAGK